MNRLYVIGIGYKPLDKKAKETILKANIIIAISRRLFEIFKRYEEFEGVKDKVEIISNIDEVISFIKSKLKTSTCAPIVLLSSGDPMFFGIGRRIIREFGKEIVEIIPDLSVIQMAFSKIKEPWDDAFLMSLHGEAEVKKLGYEAIPNLLNQYDKIAILTNNKNTPTEIGKFIASKINKQVSISVCERIGYEDEKITTGSPDEIAKMSFNQPNTVILTRVPQQETKKTGTLYGIGIGPGDPELLTLKAFNILKATPCICVPKGTQEGESVALSIVKKILPLNNKEIIEIFFPMKNKAEISNHNQADIEKVAIKLEKGVDVAFITLGDPTIYSTFFYLYQNLSKLTTDLKIEIIPGVSSITTAASKIGIPLGIADEKIAILPANYISLSYLESDIIDQFDTIVLMKIQKEFTPIVQLLKDKGLLDKTVYVSKVGMEGEKIFKNLQEIKKEDIDYFSMVIIKK